ncbi:hypothetical protein EVAR_47736_1 [Eumeta japonica]|uniref:Uncharacterized protein n=1 Tax=Eumeta variegata TaxID=151549 RepID=A0A4C1VVM6_EUMVA|nr:hypothetical protein EVAR_47736_1 [Eumeta japonica]
MSYLVVEPWSARVGVTDIDSHPITALKKPTTKGVRKYFDVLTAMMTQCHVYFSCIRFRCYNYTVVQFDNILGLIDGTRTSPVTLICILIGAMRSEH